MARQIPAANCPAGALTVGDTKWTLIFLILGLASPSLLKRPNFVWWRFSRVLRWVSTRILLTVFFAVDLTPVGVAFHLHAGWAS